MFPIFLETIFFQKGDHIEFFFTTILSAQRNINTCMKRRFYTLENIEHTTTHTSLLDYVNFHLFFFITTFVAFFHFRVVFEFIWSSPTCPFFQNCKQLVHLGFEETGNLIQNNQPLVFRIADVVGEFSMRETHRIVGIHIFLIHHICLVNRTKNFYWTKIFI